MKSTKENIVLSIAILVSLATYLFWDYFPKGTFYIGNAVFFFLLSIYIILKNYNFLTFFLFGIALNNLLDEMFFDPTKLGWSELSLVIVLPLIYRYYARR